MYFFFIFLYKRDGGCFFIEKSQSTSKICDIIENDIRDYLKNELKENLFSNSIQYVRIFQFIVLMIEFSRFKLKI